jgi:hypothetical protein
MPFDIDRRQAGYAEFRDAPFDPARGRCRPIRPAICGVDSHEDNRYLVR